LGHSPAMGDSLSIGKSKSFLKFMGRSKMKRGESVDDLSLKTSSTTDREDIEDAVFFLRGSRHKHALSLSMGAYSHAISILKGRKPPSITLADSESCKYSSGTEPPAISSSGENPIFRIEDPFNSELNRCDARALPHLRVKRVDAPILCYESDGDEYSLLQNAEDEMEGQQEQKGCGSAPTSSPAATEADVALRSRLEALQVQKKLYGSEHPDVRFFEEYIARHRRRRLATAGTHVRDRCHGVSRSRYLVASYTHYYRGTNEMADAVDVAAPMF